MKLLIAGATGLVGNLVLQQALADNRVSRVIALTRRSVAQHDKLENVVIDFSDMPADAAWWSVDGVICALGTTRAKTSDSVAYRAIDYGYPLAVARHTRDHGATRFALTSSLGANPRSRFIYTRTKGELEEDLKKIGFPSLTIVQPSVIEGPRDEQRFNERSATIILRMLAPVLPQAWRISPASAIAATLLEAALEGPPGIHVKTNKDMKAGAP